MAILRSAGGISLTRTPPIFNSPAVTLSRPGDQAEQRGLAAAGRADEDDELAVLDLEVDAVEHLDGAEGLVHAGERDVSHYFTAPAVRPRTRWREKRT